MPFFQSDNYKDQDIELIRISATNEMRIIDQKLIEIEKASNSNQLEEYIGILGSIDIKPLKNIEKQIIFAETKYQEKDPYLLNLRKSKKLH